MCQGGGSVAAAETPLPHAEDDGYNLKSMIRQQLAEWVSQAAQAAQEAGALAFDVLPAFEIETPRNPQFGDYAANLAMLLAKQARRNPREVAEAIRQHLPEDAFAWVERVEVAGAGFLNFYLKPDWRARLCATSCSAGLGTAT